jgi:UDP-N-acetylmuramoyl-L-alanyl-D-glutamate--2,6-diaminopimelate ligase
MLLRTVIGDEHLAAMLTEVVGESDIDVIDMTHDSRQVQPGWLYCALPGRNHDGTSFVTGAIERGAVAICTSRPLDVAVPQLICRDPRAAMAVLAAIVHDRPATKLRTVAVTGTNGKTTTVRLCAAIAQANGWTADTIGTLTGARTTPESSDLQRALHNMVDRDVDFVALEATSIGLMEHRLDALVSDVAVFLNLARDHLDYHATMEAYFDAKARLFTPSHCRRAVVNGDDLHGRLLADAADVPTTSFGFLDIGDLEMLATGSHFTWRGHAVAFGMAGRFNVANAIAAASAMSALGVADEVIAKGLSDVAPVPGRFELVDCGQPFSVVVDFAHTPDAVAALMAAARELAGSGQLIVVLGCGGDRDRTKRPLMAQQVAAVADVFVMTSDNPRSEVPDAIIWDMRAGLMDGDIDAPVDELALLAPYARCAVHVELDRTQAIAEALGHAGPGDVVVIAGKGHETTQEFATHTIDFDDRSVARTWLTVESGQRPASGEVSA